MTASRQAQEGELRIQGREVAVRALRRREEGRALRAKQERSQALRDGDLARARRLAMLLELLSQADPAPSDKKWCELCKVFLPTACFLRTQDPNVCLKHLKVADHKKLQPVQCRRCRKERDPTEYHTQTLKNLQQEERLHEAVCLHCAPTHIPVGREEKKHTCNLCLEPLPLSAFSMAVQKMIGGRASRSVRCLDCQFPLCASCGMRPDSLLNTQRAPKSKADLDKFLCLACKYPNCAMCGRAMEEWRKRRWRRKAETPNKTWTCSECLG